MRPLDTLGKLIARTYAKHYTALHKTRAATAETDAWNATLDELASPRDFPSKEERFERRRLIAHALYSVAPKVALRGGDSYRVAVRDAVRELKSEGLLIKALKKAWKDVLAEYPRGYREDIESEMYGIVMFDRKGRLQSWTIDHSQYFRGHSGPSAWIPVGNVTWKDVEDAISETLADAELRR